MCLSGFVLTVGNDPVCAFPVFEDELQHCFVCLQSIHALFLFPNSSFAQRIRYQLKMKSSTKDPTFDNNSKGNYFYSTPSIYHNYLPFNNKLFKLKKELYANLYTEIHLFTGFNYFSYSNFIYLARHMYLRLNLKRVISTKGHLLNTKIH